MSDLSTYGDIAVDLVNSGHPRDPDHDRLCRPADVLRLLGRDAYRFEGQVGPPEVAALRAARERFRAVFTKVDAGDAAGAVGVLNTILAGARIRPELSDHDGEGWHLHLSRGRESPSGVYVATAAMGLAARIAAVGLDRLGVCQAAPCVRVYLDTSTNRSRRYCCERCATRANVAAYRARRRDA
ncbi:MAG TPA: CGNR zinc finger domain-containing protein [Actinomycetes bacterium]|nr:CGNR zinc finger domain-containing protein [Actinomycetes bacterium]